jgi:hypothetical protein
MRFRRRVSVAVFLFLVLFACQSVRAQDIHPLFTPPFVGIVAGVPFSAWSAGQTQIFVFAVSPQSAVNLYLTNNGGASHTITVSTFSTGSSNVADFTNNQAQWTAFATVNIATGASASVQALTLLANSTTILGSGISNAAQIAVKLSVAAASADTLTLTAVLTPNGVTGLTQVTGIKTMNTPSGCPSCNPVLIAGIDSSLNVLVPTIGGSDGGNQGIGIISTPGTITANLGNGSIQNLGAASHPLAVTQITNNGLANHITTATTTTACASRCELKDVIVGHGVAASTVTVQCPSGTPIAVLDSVNQGMYHFGVNCATVVIVTNAATDVTVLFQN